MKTTAQITVFCPHPSDDIHNWAAEGLLKLERHALRAGDITGPRLFYGANEQAEEDARTAALAKTEGALINIVDNLADSDFITPAIVDRDPVTVAIGTEGAAPVCAGASNKSRSRGDLANKSGRACTNWQSVSRSGQCAALRAAAARFLVGILFQYRPTGV